jgi:hypothetical protein
MNNILSAMRNSPQLTRVWVRTGDAKTPLVCVWKDASLTLVERTDPSSLKNEVGGIGLCA